MASPIEFKPQKVDPREELQRRLQAAPMEHAESILVALDVLEAALEKGPWILGDNFSAADIAIGAALNFSVRLFKMVPSRPSFDAYLARCVDRPAFQIAEKLTSGQA